MSRALLIQPRLRSTLVERIDMTDATCAYEGCEKPRATHRNWCNTHYFRQYRYGDMATDRSRVAVAEDWATPNGYRKRRVPGHVIAGATGLVYTHRLVLFDKIGYGPHLCHWCSAPINWGTRLDADHVDHDRMNNDRANLVESCQPCNRRRTHDPKISPLPTSA